MIDPTSPPNPENSPNEKLLVQRQQLWTPNAMSQYLEAEGLDTETAGKIGRAFGKLEQETRYEYKQLIDELQRWANIHTHPGSGDGDGSGGGFSSEWTYGTPMPSAMDDARVVYFQEKYHIVSNFRTYIHWAYDPVADTWDTSLTTAR